MATSKRSAVGGDLVGHQRSGRYDRIAKVESEVKVFENEREAIAAPIKADLVTNKAAWDKQTKVPEVEASNAVAIREAELMEVKCKNALRLTEKLTAEQLSMATVQYDTQNHSLHQLEEVSPLCPSSPHLDSGQIPALPQCFFFHILFKRLVSRVDYTTVFIFRLLMFLDNGLAAGMGLDLGWQQRYARFCGRVVVLSVLVLLLYPFLWVWTVIGTLWFSTARGCVSSHILDLPEEGQKWGFLIWLLFSYCGLACIACVAVGKVLVDMIRVPDWAFEAVGLEMRVGQDTAYHPGLYLSAAQREAVEALIQELPKFRLKAVPTDCSECPICLEEFHVGNEVRGLPCAHNFHVECIDQWLRLNVKCPRCRCSVFPNLDLSALNNLRSTSEPDHPSASASDVTTATAATRYERSQPAGQSYLVRLQGLLLRPVRHESMESGGEPAVANSSSVGPEELPSIVVDDGHQLPDR
ncbi:E3 ubiquitin-protein ligase SIS3 [Dichanthelium oligosanthes]|uniref:E3 ubiquitin-protein ligase SIS3 n=1 Tax=Dichanthelium oligosanthes TaxID=888268 RepID=A0A1E5WD51_9POAL|nr:E3 ubiquitin-protein ligase SIS3 [Dichanthelium oligosanthes]